MISAAFEYHRPATVPEAVAILVRHGEEARPLAGGHSLIPMMKLRLATPAHLVDLRDLGELKGIRVTGERLVVGAMTTQHELLASPYVADHCPILHEAATVIADPQVRYMGTLGGNVANGDPGNDMPAIMLCLGASYRLQGESGERAVPAVEFYRGPFDTALGEGELLTAVEIPLPAKGHGHAYAKLKRKTGDYATAAAAVVLSLAKGRCERASVALTNLGATPILAAEAAKALVGTVVDEPAIRAAGAAARKVVAPAADLRGSVEYRTAMAGVMTERAVRLARQRARG